MNWDFIIKYLPMYERAALLTVKLGLAGVICAIIVGLICAIIQYEKVPVARQIVAVYIELSRNTPLLVQLFFIYYGLPKIGIQTDPQTCGIVGLTFLGGSYMAEAFRSGLETVAAIQTESALSLGMSRLQVMRYVVLPQAFKNIIPEMANTFLTNLKMTSVLNVIAVQELFMAAKTVGGNYYKYFESYLVIAVIYFVLCFVFDKIFKFIEKKMQGKTDYALAIEYMDNQ